MSDIKLFRITKGQATELHGAASDLEKPMQNLIEANLGAFLGIRFLASEYSTARHTACASTERAAPGVHGGGIHQV